ncbi:hypothetical protein TDB9533_00024 [Thalassocella blandensis]|nr:hypothetical protein TDB9533_00024 [Thalassocella blandensis]
MHGVNRSLSQFNSHRLQTDLQNRLRNEASIGSQQFNSAAKTNKSTEVTAFAAPGASSNDFEELGFMMQKTMESKNKSLRRRKISNENVAHLGDKGEQNQRISDIEKLRKVYEQLDNAYNPNHLQKHAKHLYELSSKGEGFSFNDSSLPAASYIQLKEAENIAITLHDKTAQKNIQNKLTELNSDENFSRKIDAGLNTAEIFSEAFSNDSDRSKARSLYYDNIMGASDVSSMFQALGNSMGWNKLSHSIDTMQGAILRDMNANKPSTDFKQLATKIQDLQRINEIRSVASDCTEFRKSMIEQGVMRA